MYGVASQLVILTPRRRKRLTKPQQQQPRRRNDFSLTKKHATTGRAAKRRRLSKLLEELQRHLDSYDDETVLPTGPPLGINPNKRRFHARRIPTTNKRWISSPTLPSPKTLNAVCRCPPGRALGGPVCGEDGRTHLSACHAKCRARTRAECRGRCPCVEDVGASQEGEIRDTLPVLDGKGRARLVRIPTGKSTEGSQEEESGMYGICTVLKII